MATTFGSPTRTADGFTVQITDYDGSWTYTLSVTSGTATISGTGLVTVTGVAAATNVQVTVNATKYDESNQSSAIGSTSLGVERATSFAGAYNMYSTANYSVVGTTTVTAVVTGASDGRLWLRINTTGTLNFTVAANSEGGYDGGRLYRAAEGSLPAPHIPVGLAFDSSAIPGLNVILGSPGRSGTESSTGTVSVTAGQYLVLRYTKDSDGTLGDDNITATLSITPDVVARTLYYNAAVSADWNDLGNWWTTNTAGALSDPASALPTAIDDVILTGSVVTNTGGAIEVSTLAMTTVAGGYVLGVDVTISGGSGYNGIFTNSSIGAGVTVTGNCEFIGSQAGGVGAASNSGTITGNALFTGDVGVLPCVVAAPVENFGTVSGNAVFNGNSRNASTGTVTGSTNFNDNSYNDGTVYAGLTTYNGFTGGTCAGYFVILGAPASGLDSAGRGTYAGNGLFYTDYPTLAEGYDNINSVYYFAGVATQLNEDGTGWDATLDDYYIEAVATGMSQLGTGFYNGDHYYLGSIFTPITYAFMGTSNGDWNNLSNWLADYNISLPAGRLPTATDNVELRASVTSNGGGPPTVANLSTVPSNPNSNLRLDIPITVTGTATFNGEWYYTQTITGNVAFSSASFTNWPYNYATGTTTFTSLTPVAFAATSSWYTDASSWIFDAPDDPVWTFSAGTQLGTAGNIHGNVIFNTAYSSGSYNSGQITGDVTFNGNYAYNQGQITGTATFNGGSYNGNQSSYSAGAVVTGTAIFNDYSYNNGTVTGDAEFSGAEFTNSSPTGSGSVSGTTTFTAAMPVVFNWGSVFSWTYDTSLWVFTTSGQNWIFSSGDNSSVIKGDAAFSGFSVNNYNGTVDGNATFAEYSSNRGTVSHDATFNGFSYNTGTVSEDATFSAEYLSAANGNNPLGTLNGGVTFSSATLVTFTLDSNYGWSNWNYDSTAWSFTAPGQNWIFNGSAYNSGILIGDATFNSSSHNDGTVSNDATFNGGYNHTSGVVSNDATFGGGSYNSGTVMHDATFDDSSHNDGTVSNNATFNSSSHNEDMVTNDATFNGSSYNSMYGTVGHDATFNSSSTNSGTVTNAATFNDSSHNGTGTVSGAATFSASSFSEVFGVIPLGTLNGSVTFSSNTAVTFTLDSNTGWGSWTYDSTAWSFTAPGQNWIFNNSSYNNNILNGDATFNTSSYNNSGSTVSNNATFNGSSTNNGTVSNDATFNESSFNTDYGTVYNAIFNGISYNNTNSAVTNDATFNVTSHNEGIVSNNATFNDNSYNSTSSTVSNDATFNDSSYNAGTINGDATFNHNSYSASSASFNVGTNLVFNQNSQLRGSIDVNSVAFRENSQNTYGIGGALSAAPNTIVVAHGGGINGSNILGMF